MKIPTTIASVAAILVFGWLLAENGKPRQLGGDVVPSRSIVDPFPEFNGLAVDPENNVVMATDTNRKSVLVYDRTRGSATEEMEPLQQIIGPETNIGFVAGAVVDPRRREMFAVNNDIEDTVMVWPYGTEANARPTRLLSVPHQAWGLALSLTRNELAVTVEMQNAVVIYRREAVGLEPPLRVIRGTKTGMADPHGVYWDDVHGEIGVANHGNYRGLAKNMGLGCTAKTPADDDEAGQLQLPSITVYSAAAGGDAPALRTIQGPQTRLDWPMGVSVDAAHDEIAVANNGDNSILIFRRTSRGDSAPIRVIAGGRTGVNRPMGVAFDAKNDELWVANFGDHTAEVFSRTASGDAASKRVIRNAPPGTPSTNFGNPMALGYDSKRGEILVPN